MNFFKTKNILLFAILTTIVLFVIDLLVYGPGISGDTAGYLSLAGDVYRGKTPFSPSYLPGFPLLVGLTAKITSIKIVQSASVWIVLFYVLNLIYIRNITRFLNKSGKITSIGSYFLFFVLSSWWSFRIQKATHADAMYFSLLIMLTYYLLKAFQVSKLKYFLITGFVLALMAITKYNSYVIILILGLVILISKIEFKKKIIFLISSLVPSFIMIFIWKIINGRVIYALELNNYENSPNNTQ
jgi:4-amino-4-deoxy-L-arabinose transferase-like glycosyltransferase